MGGKEEDVGKGLGENVYSRKWRGGVQPSVHRCLAWTSNAYPSLGNEIGHNSEVLLDEYPEEKLVNTTVLMQTFITVLDW